MLTLDKLALLSSQVTAVRVPDPSTMTRRITETDKGGFVIGAHDIEFSYPMPRFSLGESTSATEFRLAPIIPSQDSLVTAEYERVLPLMIEILQLGFARHSGSVNLSNYRLTGPGATAETGAVQFCHGVYSSLQP